MATPTRPFDHPVYVTRPLLPPLDAYSARLAQIWEAKWLTNDGAQLRALEAALSQHLRAPHLSLLANGTLALLVACRVLELHGEVITTPFTFAATPNALVWSGLEPVFADIDTRTLTLDPRRVEAAITPRTSAILGVHVYGISCDVHALEAIATRHGLRVIYDGAHAFGTTVDGVPLGAFGNATMLSFHATKLFHTGEGGALIVRDAATKARVDLARNFGIASEFEFASTGINGKMSELSAALGLEVLARVDEERVRREVVASIYDAGLEGLSGIDVLRPPANASRSLQYYVIRVDETAAGRSRDEVYQVLREFNVHARAYCHPLVSDFPCYRSLPSAQPDHLPAARAAAAQVLCLPFHGGLAHADAERICEIVAHCLRHP
jgi:dTDP-4-amino-4,6-dideoxygalactose transaminase